MWLNIPKEKHNSLYWYTFMSFVPFTICLYCFKSILSFWFFTLLIMIHNNSLKGLAFFSALMLCIKLCLQDSKRIFIVISDFCLCCPLIKTTCILGMLHYFLLTSLHWLCSKRQSHSQRQRLEAIRRTARKLEGRMMEKGPSSSSAQESRKRFVRWMFTCMIISEVCFL